MKVCMQIPTSAKCRLPNLICQGPLAFNFNASVVWSAEQSLLACKPCQNPGKLYRLLSLCLNLQRESRSSH